MKTRPIESYAAWAASLAPARFVLRPVVGRGPGGFLWFVYCRESGKAWEYPDGPTALAECVRMNLELN